MKIIQLLGVIGLSVNFLNIACNNGSLADPKTVSKGDLNPPTNLVSLTTNADAENGGLVLQWDIVNTEDDVVGYNVYVAQKEISALQAKITDTTLKTLNLYNQNIPRCEGTKDLFSLFGFNLTDKNATTACSKAGVEEDTSTSSAAAAASLNLTDEAITSKFVKCFMKAKDSAFVDISGANVSLDITKLYGVDDLAISATDRTKLVGKRIKCKIPTTIDGKTASTKTKLSDDTTLANGKIYTAFVVAVMGEKATKMSWASNFVEDSPMSYTIMGSNALGTPSVPKYRALNLLTTPLTNWSFEADCPTDFTARKCSLYNNNPVTSLNNLYVFSDDQGCVAGGGTATCTARLFIAGNENDVYLLKRNPRGQINNYSGIFDPGDEPITVSTDPTASGYVSGKLIVAYAGDLFDIYIRTTRQYGKIYFDNVTASSTAYSFESSIGIQSPNITHYLTDLTDLSNKFIK